MAWEIYERQELICWRSEDGEGNTVWSYSLMHGEPKSGLPSKAAALRALIGDLKSLEESYRSNCSC